jgi:hypothetical protein
LTNTAAQWISVAEYVRGERSPVSRLAHQWELHSATLLSPSEERTMVREPAQAVPDAIAERIGPVRVLAVPYVACTKDGDFVSFTKPEVESHTSVWIPGEAATQIVLACREMDAHDTGFELLASVAELLRARLTPGEMGEFETLLEVELREGVTGEIDEEAARAKQDFASHATRDNAREKFESYRNVSLVETVAEYMHGLWHDVQIRIGPEHLPLPQLRKRMDFLARLFPPNEGYQVYDEDLQRHSNAEATEQH